MHDHLQQFRANKFSTFFKSEAFMFSSASFIALIQLWPETLRHIERFSRLFLFIAFDDFFLSVFSKAMFISFAFFLQILNYVSEGF